MSSLFDNDPPPSSNEYASIDPDVIRTIIGEGDPAYIASVLANRKAKSGVDYNTLITDPTQFEARTGDAWANNSKISTDDPRYQKALAVAGPILLGKSKPITDADSFYNPTVQSGDGRSKPSWDDGTGVKGPDGQLYFSGKFNRSSSLFDDSKTPTTPVTTPPPVDNVALDSATDNAANNPDADDPDKSWPVYDPYNKVGRNKDGSIAYVGKAPSVSPGQNGGESTINVTGQSTDPKAIQEWLSSHPDDIANKGTFKPEDTSGNPALVGLGQGVRNVGDSIAGVAAPFVPGVRDALTQNLMDRQTNDANNGNDLGYNLGKFGGELAATAPTALIPGADGAWLGKGLLSMVGKGALQGTETAALTSAGSNTSLSQQLATGAITGAVAAPIFHGVGSAISKYINPTVPSHIADLANKANQFGLKLDTPQIKGAVDDVNYKTSPGGRIVNPKTQSTQALQAVGSTFGMSPDVVADKGLTPEVVEAQRRTVGQNINTARSQLSLSGPDLDNLFTNLDNVRSNINANMNSTDSKALRDTIRNINIQTTRNSGTFDGDSYHALTTKGGPLNKLLNSKDTNVQRYAGDIKEAIDTSFEQTNQPASDAFRTARTQYKNLKSVEGKVPFYSHNGIGLLQDIGKSNTQFYGDHVPGNPGDLANIGRTFYNRGVAPKSKFGVTGLTTLGGALGGEGYLIGTHPQLALGAGLGAGLLTGAKFGGNAAIRALQNNSIRNSISGKSAATPITNYLANKFSIPTTALAVKQGINN